jgi:hypothetical protein
MKRIEKEVPSRAMTQVQRRKVESNLPLVKLTLRRHRDLTRPSRPGREAGELLQEGRLALVEAVRSHDPARHGDFATYAMARIHYAMSRFAQEHGDSIRVPFITQRRGRRRRQKSGSDRHRPDAMPRVVRLGHLRMTSSRRRAARVYSERLAARAEGATIGELVRERYDRAVEQVVAGMRQSHHTAAGSEELLDRCLQERWTVPEPDAQTPIRQMAKELGCSIGRVTHCEDRFRLHVAAVLLRDEVCTLLLQMAHRCEAGMHHRLTEPELTQLDRAEREASSAGADQSAG